MTRMLMATLLTATVSMAGPARDDTAERLKEATTVFREIMDTPDRSIPRDLLEKAHCVVIVPSMKQGAFIVGAKYGKGFILCRGRGRQGWSAPGAIRMEGGSFGFQIGGSETDVVMLVMNARGAQRLMSSKFTLGAEGSVAAGPVGRSVTAETDARMTAEILSWSRSRGVFAGVALKGATLREDRKDNAALYGAQLRNRDVVGSWRAAPRAGQPLVALLTRYSPHELR